ALQAINDPLTAATVVPLLRTDNELVRETIVIVLGNTKSDEVKRWLRTQGLSGHRGVTRAYVARVLGNLGDTGSGEELLKYTGDGFWLTRAHVARALGLVGHEPAIPVLKEMVKDKAQKVRIAAMDAVGRFGERAGSAWSMVSDELGTSAWQVRSAAAECLGKLGQMASVEPLISRMEIETGRIRKDIREALKKVTRDDLGSNPKHWRDWWEKEKDRAGGGLPKRGDKPKENPKVASRSVTKTPTYYGIQVFSEGVGYVLDVSQSMNTTIKIDPNWIKKQRREYPHHAARFDLAMNEINASLKSLDPRVRFNLYFFRSQAYTWKSDMVPASSSNVNSAKNRLASERPPDAGGGDSYRTNYVDVFRLVLDVKPGKDLVGNFADTPDTIFFLTDGEPTVGDITNTEVLNSWFRELNRFARVKVNVITFGNLGIDPVFLRRLAEDNGGVFVQVPEVR
ncbi:MAG: HEAT repeat domain-containing protein, partial [Planctomycetota bacterium]